MAKIQGKYVLETELTPKKATGINLTQLNDGSLIISFFDEIPPVPSMFHIETDESGKAVSDIDSSDSISSNRVIHSRITMKKDEAIFLFKMLIDKLEGENND